MRLTVRIVAVALAIGVVTSAVAARQASPRNASYTLAAALDPAARTIAGRGRLTWRNIASRPATELQFHMYWNAWRDPSSTFFRELRDPTAARSLTDPGAIDLTSFALVTKLANAWVKNPAEEGRVVDALKKGDKLVIRSESKRGSKLTDEYSLKGFNEAFARVQRECP